MVAKCVPIALLALLMLAQPLFAGKILGYFITPSRSHFIIEDSLMRGLAAKGHDVIYNLYSKQMFQLQKLTISTFRLRWSAFFRLRQNRSQTTLRSSWK